MYSVQGMNFYTILVYPLKSLFNKTLSEQARINSNFFIKYFFNSNISASYSNLKNQMNEDQSQFDYTKNKQSMQEGAQKKISRHTPFQKLNTVSFVKIGNCHMCKNKNKVVYQCYRNYIATSCEKKFCLDCLLLIYKDNIIEHMQKNDSWKCPYHRKICRCKNCCNNRKQFYSTLEIDSNQTVYTSLRTKLTPIQQIIQPKNYDEDDEVEVDENMKCLLRQKFKKLIQMNGQLIGKVNANYHKLSEEEIRFYNKLIHSNLKVINHMAQNMIAHQSLTDEG